MCDKKTVNYYDENSIDYFSTTVSIDMTSTYERFLRYVPIDGHIVDIGVGSGRDIAYFYKAGYCVDGIDPSIEMCRLASEYSGIDVENVSIQKWEPLCKYDGIWANASLVHLTKEDFTKFINDIHLYLKDNGIAYFSIKSGMVSERDLNGRLFLNLSEYEIDTIVSDSRSLVIVEKWLSSDKMSRQNINWMNYIVKNRGGYC